MTSAFTIDVRIHQQRVVYREPGRSASVRLECDSRDDWWLWPDTLNWWERTDADRSLPSGVTREPIGENDRDGILSRVVGELRQKRGIWVNIAGRAADPKPPGWRAPPVRNDADPELALILNEAMDAATAGDSGRVFTDRETARLISDIDAALTTIQPMADAGWAQAQSISRQLRWCRGMLGGEAVEAPPGPLSMGLIATREFDMYGADPDPARLINSIQDEMRRRGAV